MVAERGPITCLFQRLPPLYGNRSVDHLPCGRPSPGHTHTHTLGANVSCGGVLQSTEKDELVLKSPKLALVIITYSTRVSCQSLRYSNTNPGL